MYVYKFSYKVCPCVSSTSEEVVLHDKISQK